MRWTQCVCHSCAVGEVVGTPGCVYSMLRWVGVDVYDASTLPRSQLWLHGGGVCSVVSWVPWC